MIALPKSAETKLLATENELLFESTP